MKKSASSSRTPLFKVRHSPIHGYGVFAARRIRKGTTVIEYLGDRITHAKADARYEDKDPNDNHTFLFTVDSRTVIDAGVNGNEARYVNHGCDPNCESTILNKRIFIEAIRTIQPGEELSYDYQIQRDSDDADNVDEVFACRCGAKNCRNTMLEGEKPRKVTMRARAGVGGKAGVLKRKFTADKQAVAKRKTGVGKTAVKRAAAATKGVATKKEAAAVRAAAAGKGSARGNKTGPKKSVVKRSPRRGR